MSFVRILALDLSIFWECHRTVLLNSAFALIIVFTGQLQESVVQILSLKSSLASL